MKLATGCCPKWAPTAHCPRLLQGRWRVFMFAAAPGQQLPAIPKPTHNCIKFQVGPGGGRVSPEMDLARMQLAS